jgi:hypothetical protein
MKHGGRLCCAIQARYGVSRGILRPLPRFRLAAKGPPGSPTQTLPTLPGTSRRSCARQILSGQFEAGLKLPVTYHVVIAFDRDAEGDLKPGEAREVLSPIVAERRARALALEHAGAVAFSRTGDPATGEFQDAVILARFGEVDLHSLGE